jgi:hypothetical protein
MSEGLLGVLGAIRGESGQGSSGSRLKRHEQVAVDFASALVAGQFARAQEFLTPALRREWSPERLRESLFGMFSGYAQGKPRRIHFEPDFSHDDWPDKRQGDLGWVYVAIEGDDFNEAVAVIVTEVDGNALIREIEWGRP